MLVDHGGKLGHNPFSDYLHLLTKEHFRLMVQHGQGAQTYDALQLELAAHYHASAFTGALRWWLEQDMPYSAEEMAEMVSRQVLFGVRALAEGLA